MELQIENPESRIGKPPLALVILDGWGHSPMKEGNAIALAHTPNFDEIWRKYPRTLLAAAGPRVGLTPEAPGNSEVGHLNLGAGRIIETDVSRVSKAIESGEFFQNEVLTRAFAKAKRGAKSVHLVGLLSDGDVHASPENLFALLRMARNEGLEDVFVHAVLDGLDVRPRTADIYVEALEIKMADIGAGRIASLCGRHYAMDKDEHWERTARVYTMLVHAEGEHAADPVTAIRNSFLRGISDEFIQPIVLEKSPDVPVALVAEGDLVIFFNHRADGMRQLVKALSVSSINEVGKPTVDTVCLVEYDRNFGLPAAFEPRNEENVLARVFADLGIPNCRITETEKCAHLTYFFNGGSDTEHSCEKRLFVQSLDHDAQEFQPEMKCFKVTDTFLRSLESNENEVFIVNIPSSDMVAHSGNLEKTIESVQFVDTCLGGIVAKIRELNGVAIVTSDHGNCEEMADLLTGEPNNSHTANPVPFLIVDDRADGLVLRENGALEDVAPTILGILGIEKPREMTGRDLREK